MNISRSTLGLTTLCSLLAGILIGGGMLAHAEPPTPPLDVPLDHDLALFCRPFETPLDGGSAAFETTDRTTMMGRWIGEHSPRYTLHSIDFQVAQKSTGYPVAYNQVCLRPR